MEFPIDEKCEILMRGVESLLPTEDDDGLKEQMINIEHPNGRTKPQDPWMKKSNPTKMVKMKKILASFHWTSCAS
jgi:hypothetical protein